MFKAVPYKQENYTELAGWWYSWGWPPIPEWFLPPDGIIVSYDNQNICAVFMYKTNSPICWAENYISSKDAPKGIRGEALDLLLETLIHKTKEDGYQIIMSSINHPLLAKRLQKHDFFVSDTNMTTYMRQV